MTLSKVHLLCGALGVASVGCNAESASEPVEGVRTFRQAALPTASGDASDCDGVQPTLCDWVASSDAIVVGTVTSVEPRATPFVQQSGSDEVLEESGACAGNLSVALAIGIRVDDVLAGEVDGKELEVMVGYRAQREWHPYAVLTDEGALGWWDLPAGAEAPLATGSTLGLAIRRYPGRALWTLAGQMPFTFTETGSPIFVSPDTCPNFFPPAVEAGVSYADFRAAVAACPASGEPESLPYLQPITGFAAYCSADNEEPGFCKTDAGCTRPQQRCQNGQCVAAPGYEDWVPAED